MNKRPFESISWTEDNTLLLLDQKQIPHKIVYIECDSVTDVFDCIVDMTVRGAPAIGIAAAYGVALASIEAKQSGKNIIQECFEAIDYLSKSRPTAVNLFWALNKMKSFLQNLKQSSKADETIQELIAQAHIIYNEDIQTNILIAKHGLEVVPQNANFIHHCNTGSLATADYGTALGIIRYAHEHGKNVHVYLDETRPRFQGLSLSAFEMKSFNVPYTVIVDGASGFVMKRKKVDLCVVGCDRVCANGDTANKIGTYNLAIAAKAHNIPFYVACPISSIDLNCESGDSIEIEERNAKEITESFGQLIGPEGANVFNPAFDITPSELITGFITEKGIFTSIKAILTFIL